MARLAAGAGCSAAKRGRFFDVEGAAQDPHGGVPRGARGCSARGFGSAFDGQTVGTVLLLGKRWESCAYAAASKRDPCRARKGRTRRSGKGRLR